ncbi:MAG TPA: class I SAM-dependent methyltransferase [Candidatus Acidoferrum sp.]
MHALNATVTQSEVLLGPENYSQPRHSAWFIGLRCPRCGHDLSSASYRSLARNHPGMFCGGCFALFSQEHGIWLALPPGRKNYFSRFAVEYQYIRRQEGRGSADPEFYLALPFRDLTGRNAWQWAIRARTFCQIESKILPRLTTGKNPSLAILDLGAGNGWLSHRLALSDHRPVAIDLLTNSYDGLGAAYHYFRSSREIFPRFQAELDNLPFADGQFDCAIFNASFHYSENYDRTLSEAIRCLRPGGTILIADSPTYQAEASGHLMQQERRREFQHRFGFASDGLASCDYLTPERLIALEVRHDLRWKTHKIWYGAKWALRPWIARLKNRREPSDFFLYSTQVKLQ